MSAGIAALVAHVGFWTLLAYGLFWEDVGPRLAAALVAVWLTGYLFVRPLQYGDGLFVAWVALLGVVLVFVIFKGDVRLN